MEPRSLRRVVMVAYTRYPWDPRVRREAETLVRLGYEVHVLCVRDSGDRAEESLEGVAVHRLPLPIRRGGPLRYLYQYAVFLLLAWASVRRMRRRPGLAAVHVHSLPDFLAFVGLGARVRGTPLILDLHEAMPEIYAARFPGSVVGRRLAILAEKVSCRIATRVIVVNDTIRDLLVGRGVPADRILVVYNSPDVAAPPRDAIAPKPSHGPLRLVYAGTMDQERDIATLLRAVAKLRESRPVALALFGPCPDDHRAYLEGLVDGLGLRDAVQFGGLLPADRVLAHLAEADVGVVTYARNPITEVGLPNKVFEYVVLEKPLVLPRLRAMRRAFQGAALFYEPGDPTDLAAKVLVASAGGPEVLRMLARARVVYDAARWDVQAERLAAAYAAPEG